MNASTRPARVGDLFFFNYPDEPMHNRNLIVTKVTGDEPDDLVFFEDSTHSKQKNLAKVPSLRSGDVYTGVPIHVRLP